MPNKSFFLTEINPFVVANCHKGVDESGHFISLFQRLDDKGEIVVLVGQHILLSRPGTP